MGRSNKTRLRITATGCFVALILSACAPNVDFRMRLWESFMRSGITERAENRPEQARAAFEAALAQLADGDDNRRRVATMVELGWTHLQTGDAQKAATLYREATRLSDALVANAAPEFKSSALLLQARSMLGLGQALLGTNKLDESGHWFDQAVSLYDKAAPRNELGRDTCGSVLVTALMGKADVLSRQGQMGAAGLIYKRAAIEANATPGALKLKNECLQRLDSVAPYEHLPAILHAPYDG